MAQTFPGLGGAALDDLKLRTIGLASEFRVWHSHNESFPAIAHIPAVRDLCAAFRQFLRRYSAAGPQPITQTSDNRTPAFGAVASTPTCAYGPLPKCGAQGVYANFFLIHASELDGPTNGPYNRL